MIERVLYGITVRRAKTGEYLVESIEDQKKLLSRIATDMLNGNKKARILAEDINKCKIKTYEKKNHLHGRPCIPGCLR